MFEPRLFSTETYLDIQQLADDIVLWDLIDVDTNQIIHTGGFVEGVVKVIEPVEIRVIHSHSEAGLCREYFKDIKHGTIYTLQGEGDFCCWYTTAINGEPGNKVRAQFIDHNTDTEITSLLQLELFAA